MIGVSYGADDGSVLRQRIVKAFDAFHDVRAMGDRDAAKLIFELRTDIIVDLTGYTAGCRPQVLAWRPAPIAVNFLGFPGTMGASFIDYIIADRITLPFDQQPFFTERIVHLPDSFQPNDSQRKIAADPPTREAAGLPEKGLVLCCFNKSYKIAGPAFDIWMRLLKAIEGSVLWLSDTNAAAGANLRTAAGARDIDPARLVFARQVEPRRASRAPSACRPVPRHLSLQCPRHGERCTMGRPACCHCRRQCLSRKGRREPFDGGRSTRPGGARCCRL